MTILIEMTVSKPSSITLHQFGSILIYNNTNYRLYIHTTIQKLMGSVRIFKVFERNVHQGCIYLIKNTVKQ